MEKVSGDFVWDEEKEKDNIRKHGISFTFAANVFLDAKRKIFTDSKHSSDEPRYFCIGKVKNRIITVRFTYRQGRIRVFGAGYWRKGRMYYEKEEN